MSNHQKALSLDSSKGLGSLVGCFGMLFGFVFCSMFFGMGSFFLWIIAIKPLVGVQTSQSWVETPCTITKSDVEGDESYRIVIEYDYTFDGQEYHGDRYDFFEMATSGRTSKERVVAKYKEGTEGVCYVDPDEPASSVLNRSLGWSLLWGLFPLPFIAIGLIGYWVIFFGKARFNNKYAKLRGVNTADESSLPMSASSSSFTPLEPTRIAKRDEWSDSNYDEEDLFEEPGAITLKSESSPLIMALVMFGFALFWNGIVSVFLFQQLDHWMNLNLSFEDYFMIPFVLVGIGLILVAIYNLLAATNPKPILILSRQLIPLGGEAELQWEFPRGIGSIRQLTIKLFAVEEARYRRGTNTYTDTEKFLNEILVECNDPVDISAGSITVQIPTDSMHSFHGGNNKVKWNIELRGDIPMWPDVKTIFPIRVVPHE